MVDSMQVTMLGGDDIAKQLDGLYRIANVNDMRAALNYAIDPVLQAARSMAPVGTKEFKTYKGRWVAPGFLKASLFKKSERSRDRTRAYAFVMLKPEAWYGKLVEQGYTRRMKGDVKRSHRGGLSSRGASGEHVAPRPFMKPAFEQNRQVMIDRNLEKLKGRIAKALAKQSVSDGGGE
jgi:hypothetical protein